MTDAPETLPPGTIPSGGGTAGTAGFQTGGDPFTALDLMVRQILAGQGQTSVVKVMSVTGGGIGTPCRVGVQPMVNQVDGLGKQTPHGTVHDLPVFRYQAGGAAVIIDPVVGDIGLAIICGRDISTVKATSDVSPPGSFRQNSWSDGCYLGGFLNAAPQKYIRWTGSAWEIVGDVTITGTLTNNGVNISSTHVHGGVQTGGGNTAVPH